MAGGSESAHCCSGNTDPKHVLLGWTRSLCIVTEGPVPTAGTNPDAAFRLAVDTVKEKPQAASPDFRQSQMAFSHLSVEGSGLILERTSLEL